MLDTDIPWKRRGRRPKAERYLVRKMSVYDRVTEVELKEDNIPTKEAWRKKINRHIGVLRCLDKPGTKK